MKLAVTYENGQIFQHFGHTEQFKIYEVADGKIVSEVHNQSQTAEKSDPQTLETGQKDA